MHDVVTKNVTRTADSIVTREVRGEDRELIKVPISSTGTDRDGDEFSEDGLRNMAEQVPKDQPLFHVNHGFLNLNKPIYDARETIGTHVDAEITDSKDEDGEKELNAFILPDLTHPEGERTLEQVKQGQAIKTSVGFKSHDTELRDPDDPDAGRIFHGADLMESSKVGIPSNPDASAAVEVAAKSAMLADQLGRNGTIEDEAAFAKALAAELMDSDTPARPGELDGVRKDAAPPEGKPKCDGDADCPDGEVCRDGHCVEEDSATHMGQNDTKEEGDPCDDNGDCGDGMVCVDGECVPEDDDDDEEDSVSVDDLRGVIREEVQAALDDETSEPDTDETDAAPTITLGGEEFAADEVQDKLDEAGVADAKTTAGDPDPDETDDETPEETTDGDDKSLQEEIHE